MNELLLVGSLPVDTAQEAFRKVGARIGGFLPYMPDGEFGERSYWIEGLAYRVLHVHPAIETLRRPRPTIEHGEQWRPDGFDDEWQFRLKSGVSVLHFGDRGWRLGYARDAANSYFVFSQMRKEGVLPRHLKFQVALPMPYSAVTSFFPDAAEHPVVVRAITDAIAEEIACIVDQIPPEDLAIQLDLAVENRYIEKTLEQSGLDAARREVDRLVSPAATLCKRIPAATALGFHSCYGTIIGWPTRKPRSLAGSVLLANAFARYAGRAVDFVHVPTVERADEDYFRPLEQLETGDARLYLGLIHHLHGADGIRRQIHVARKFRADFGIAAPCGFGRVREKPGGLVPGDVRAHNYLEAIIGDHEAAVAILKEGPPRRDAGGRPIGASAGVVR